MKSSLYSVMAKIMTGAKSVIEKYQLTSICQVLFSPVHGGLKSSDLADWIIRDQLKVRFQLQLHKYLWDNEPGR